MNFRDFRFGTTLTVGMAVFTLGTTAYASDMTDIGQHWAGTAIAKMAAAHHLSGYPDGTFKPDRTISRAEFVTMANQTFDMGISADKATTSFRDVQPSDWFYPQVAAAQQAGYIQGYADQTFQPGYEVTRVEAAVIMARLLHLDGTQTGTLLFTDAGSIPDWAVGSVNAAVYGKVFDGYADGTFQPAAKLTRAEAAVALQRALDAFPASNPPSPQPPQSPPMDAAIVSVSAVDGQLTVTFNHALATTPSLSDFSVVQSKNGSSSSPVTPTAIHWNDGLTAVTLDVSKQNVGFSSLSVVYGVSYKGGAVVNAPALTFAISAGGGSSSGSTQAWVSATSARFDGLVVTSVTAAVDPGVTKVEIWRGSNLLVGNVVPSGNAIAASLVGVAVNDVLTLKPYVSSSVKDTVNVTVH